jgi:hypothetical protein
MTALALRATSRDLAPPARAALARSAAVLPVPHPKECSAQLVLKWIRHLAGYSMHDCEIAEAIAEASRTCPIWPDDGGVLRTAALLVALAITTSNLHPTLVSPEGGFGVFQIHVPGPDVAADVLLLPRTAAYVAIELLRQGLESPGDEPLHIRLLWYPDPSRDLASQRESWLCAQRLEMAHALLTGGS